MRKINIKDIAEESWTSPKGKFAGASKEISVALGLKPLSTDLNERHPFDIEICRIPPGKSSWPYIVADNPIGGSCYYPDSKKWSVVSPGHRLIRSEPLNYYDGEE
jgi:hypothetical protein